MNVFVTGSSGWVGSAVVKQLISAGHRVTGLSRTPEKAAPLVAAGMTVVLGTLDDAELLRTHASKADAVIHTAFNHDFSKFAENAEQDRRAIEILGDALAGSRRPLVVTSGLAGLAKGRLATEDDSQTTVTPRKSEIAAQALAQRGIHVSSVRLAPSVHGVGETHGFVPILIALARKTGVSAYVEGASNGWSGVHRLDAARLYCRVLETGATEPVYHAAADERVPFKDIAAAIGRQLKLPVEARPREHFGWFSNFAALEMGASSQRTRELLGWKPTGPSLLNDLDNAEYYARVG